MSESEALDRFGTLIAHVRDAALGDILQDHAQDGSNVSGLGSLLRQNDLSPELLTGIVDHTVFNLLVAIQDAEFEHGLVVEVKLDDQNHEIAGLSDGLAGELFGERGWIASKSRYPTSPYD
ncbi:hypothetical protein [Tateyamaria sp. syn59]|uniref:hypothetical protein n=1 Tax=Tateyamaria sp. syn59 TaxID=2576942 RepID=UPI0011BD8CAA|nr:hypothetical protein [Tateyamaria sp. syn59]